AAILNKNIEFYSSISYTVIKDNQEPVRLKLHIGDIVDIVDLNEESKGVAYAKIEFIIQHKANN
ncbi:12317_t:CDS:1, partial [Rhizophagus irregularis]